MEKNKTTEERVSTVENELELAILSFLVKDVKFIKILIDRGVQSNWFINEDCKTFFERAVEFYEKYGVLITKTQFIERIRTNYMAAGVVSPLLGPYEEFYDYLTEYEYNENDFPIKFDQWRNAIVGYNTIQAYRGYHDDLKKEDIKNAHKELLEKISVIHEVYDDSEPCKVADLEEDGADLVFEDIKTRKENPDNAGFKSGYPSLDHILLPLERGKLTILFGMASAGKTSLARCIGRKIQIQYKAKILVLSFEESRVDFLRKIACSELNVSNEDILKSNISDEDLTKFNCWRDSLKESRKNREYNSWFKVMEFEAKETTLQQVINEFEKLYKDDYPDFVILDHLGLVKPPRYMKESNRSQELGDISKAFREMCKKYNFAGLMLAQANRNVIRWERNQRKIYLNIENIEGSNLPGQDADTIISIQPDEDEPGMVMIGVPKQRHGKRDVFARLMFIGDFCKFEDPENIIAAPIQNSILEQANSLEGAPYLNSNGQLEVKLWSAKVGKETIVGNAVVPVVIDSLQDITQETVSSDNSIIPGSPLPQARLIEENNLPQLPSIL